MYTIVLSQEDFREEAHWIALCDALNVPNTVKEIELSVAVISYVESD